MKRLKINIVYNSPMVLTFTILCLIATVLGLISSGGITEAVFSTCRASFKNPMTYVKMFTHVFGHADFEHFLSNASFLLLLGPLLEEKYGTVKLWCLTFVTAFITSLINALLYQGVSVCGASGIVFVFIILSSFTNFRKGEIPLTFILVATIFIGRQIFDGLFITSNISNMSHIVGGLIGSIVGYLFTRKEEQKDPENIGVYETRGEKTPYEDLVRDVKPDVTPDTGAEEGITEKTGFDRE